VSATVLGEPGDRGSSGEGAGRGGGGGGVSCDPRKGWILEAHRNRNLIPKFRGPG
jgi:hypothetical protein